MSFRPHPAPLLHTSLPFTPVPRPSSRLLRLHSPYLLSDLSSLTHPAPLLGKPLTHNIAQIRQIIKALLQRLVRRRRALVRLNAHVHLRLRRMRDRVAAELDSRAALCQYLLSKFSHQPAGALLYLERTGSC